MLAFLKAHGERLTTFKRAGLGHVIVEWTSYLVSDGLLGGR